MIETASYSNIGGRPKNEDMARFVQTAADQICVTVADGLGGHGSGEIASAAAVKIVCEGFAEAAEKKAAGCGEAAGACDSRREADAFQALLERLLRTANETVQGLQTDTCAMKTTIVVLLIDGTNAFWAHIGDSRLYYFRNGERLFQTRDHSASQIAVALGEITQEQIRFHSERSKIFRALGQEGEVTAEHGGQTLESGRHAFLLCTDGFWEYVLETEMEECLKAAKDPEDWLSRMREILEQRAPEDNDNNTASAVWVTI